jgi:polar amino acid transport system substrate-binding protein
VRFTTNRAYTPLGKLGPGVRRVVDCRQAGATVSLFLGTIARRVTFQLARQSMPDSLIARRSALLGTAMGLVAPALALAAEPALALATGTREPLVSSPERPGFVEEVAREAFRRAGLGLRVVPLPIERALVNANAGIEDGDLYRAAGFEKDYPNLVQVPQPLVDQDFVAFSLRPDIEVRGWSDLTRYRVAHITGQKIIERQLQGASNVTTVRDSELLLGLLANGRVDVIVNNRWVGLWVARRAGQTVYLLEPPLLRVPMYMYLHRKHEALVPRVADAIAEVRRDGTWQRLYDQILKPLEPAR